MISTINISLRTMSLGSMDVTCSCGADRGATLQRLLRPGWRVRWARGGGSFGRTLTKVLVWYTFLEGFHIWTVSRLGKSTSLGPGLVDQNVRATHRKLPPSRPRSTLRRVQRGSLLCAAHTVGAAPKRPYDTCCVRCLLGHSPPSRITPH